MLNIILIALIVLFVLVIIAIHVYAYYSDKDKDKLLKKLELFIIYTLLLMFVISTIMLSIY